jgi:hypothetical protein
VDNKDLSIAPGMYANTMLRLAHVENVVTIPIEAMVIRERGRVVYVLDATNHVHIRPVQVALEGSKLAEITSGLQPGERVILGGQDQYQDGEEVSPAITQEPASERQQETGGTIDLKADKHGSDGSGNDAANTPQTEGRQNGARDTHAKQSRGGAR